MPENVHSRTTQLQNALQDYWISNNASLAKLANQGVDLDTAYYLAQEYYPVNLAFPRLLAAAISQVTDENARLHLVRNLYEEHGDLDPEKTHTELFRKFICALRLDPKNIETATEDTPADKLIKHYKSVCFGGLQHQALALLYSFESLFKPSCELISQGFHKSQVLPKEAVVFFDIHAVADADHASQLQEALVRIVTSSEEWEETLLSVRQGAKLLYEFFGSVASFCSQRQADSAVK